MVSIPAKILLTEVTNSRLPVGSENYRMEDGNPGSQNEEKVVKDGRFVGGGEQRMILTMRGPGGDDTNYPPEVNPTVWTHIAGVFGGGKRKLFVNGELIESEEVRSGCGKCHQLCSDHGSP